MLYGGPKAHEQLPADPGEVVRGAEGPGPKNPGFPLDLAGKNPPETGGWVPQFCLTETGLLHIVSFKNGGVAQSVRACGSYPQCPGFKSLHRHHQLF